MGSFKPFFASMFTTWVLGVIAVVVLAWPVLQVVMFVLRLLLGVVYAISGNAPADWEGVL